MYHSSKQQRTSRKSSKASTAVHKGKGKSKMAPEPLEPDDSTQLSGAAPASPADSLNQFPTDLVSPLHTDSDSMLSKFCSTVRDEITAAYHKLSSDLVKGLKEIGNRTNHLEHRMDLATTVLEGHEEEVVKLSAELEIM